MQPQGFLGGLSSGLVGAVLANQKKQQDEFHELKNNRLKQLTALADHIRPEDLPSLLQGMDAIIGAKKPEQADAAYGNIMSKVIQERYDQEQQGIAQNQAIDQASMDRGAQTVQLNPVQSGTSEPGTLTGQPEGSSKLGIPLAYAKPSTTSSPSPTISLASSQDAIPVKVSPTAYAKDKIRLQTEEGKMGRAVKLYTAKEAALYKEKEDLERAKTDEKIRAFEKTHASELSGRSVVTYDPMRNVTIQTGRTKDGKTITQEIPGMPTSYATTQARIKAAETANKEKIKLERDKLTAKITSDAKRVAAIRERTAAMSTSSGAASKAITMQLSQLDKKWDNEKDILMKEMAKHLANAERTQGDFEEDEDYKKATSEAMQKYQEVKHKYDLGSQEYEELRQAVIDGGARGTSGQGTSGAKKSTTSSGTAPGVSVQERIKRNTNIITFDNK